MPYFYSSSTRGFYVEEEGAAELPEDAQPLSDEEYRALMSGQSTGLIDWSTGAPTLVELPAPTSDSQREQRRRAYRQESDPLKNEADYDAIVSGEEPEYTAWLAKVEEIKARYPLPDESSPVNPERAE